MRYGVVLDYGDGDSRRNYFIQTGLTLEDAEFDAEAFAVGCEVAGRLPNGDVVIAIRAEGSNWAVDREGMPPAYIRIKEGFDA